MLRGTDRLAAVLQAALATRQGIARSFVTDGKDAQNHSKAGREDPRTSGQLAYALAIAHFAKFLRTSSGIATGFRVVQSISTLMARAVATHCPSKKIAC